MDKTAVMKNAAKAFQTAKKFPDGDVRKSRLCRRDYLKGEGPAVAPLRFSHYPDWNGDQDRGDVENAVDHPRRVGCLQINSTYLHVNHVDPSAKTGPVMHEVPANKRPCMVFVIAGNKCEDTFDVVNAFIEKHGGFTDFQTLVHEETSKYYTTLTAATRQILWQQATVEAGAANFSFFLKMRDGKVIWEVGRNNFQSIGVPLADQSTFRDNTRVPVESEVLQKLHSLLCPDWGGAKFLFYPAMDQTKSIKPHVDSSGYKGYCRGGLVLEFPPDILPFTLVDYRTMRPSLERVCDVVAHGATSSDLRMLLQPFMDDVTNLYRSACERLVGGHSPEETGPLLQTIIFTASREMISRGTADTAAKVINLLLRPVVEEE